MKRILAGITAALLSFSAAATTLNPIQLLQPAGSTAGQSIVSTGPSSAPTWGSSTLAPIGANTLLGNSTGSTATPTAVSVSNCVGASSALVYTAGSGFGCNATINAVTLGGATFSAPGPIGSVSTSSGAFSSISTPSATIGGGTINNTSVGATSANSGAFTTISATGLITPSATNGIAGVTNGSAAAAGAIGQLLSASAGPISLTSGTAINITSIPLTAGDWDVWGMIQVNPAGTTTMTVFEGGISLTSATQPSINTGSVILQEQTWAAGLAQIASMAPYPINVSTTTTVYCVETVSFATSTATGFCQLYARRRH